MKSLAFAFLFVIAPFFACAQNRAGFPWWNSPVTREIGLSAEQNQKIHQIVRSYRDRLLDARNNVLKANGDLEDILNGPEVDPAKAQATIERVAAARAASTRAILEMSVRLRAVLTLDQWRQLVKRWDEVQHRKLSNTQAAP